MVNKNYFSVNRKLFKNPIWYSEKFTKGQAWIDLIGNANHSPGYFEKSGQRINLERGQSGRSIETLADDWRWSRNKVKRFLKRLKDDHMIDHKTNHLTSIITICNYNKFQPNEKNNEPSNELPDEPSNEPQTIRSNKNKKEINNIHFEKLWKDYSNTSGSKSQSLINYNSCKKKLNLTDDQIYLAAMNSEQKQKDEGKEDFIYQLSNVLGQKYSGDLINLLDYKPKKKNKYHFL